MPKPNLSAMSVDALLKLRADIEKTLSSRAAQLRRELGNCRLSLRRIHSKAERPRSSTEIGRATLGQAVAHGPDGWLQRLRKERRWMIF
jgi:hypothetical protein